jgi:hypothetical protein
VRLDDRDGVTYVTIQLANDSAIGGVEIYSGPLKALANLPPAFAWMPANKFSGRKKVLS